MGGCWLKLNFDEAPSARLGPAHPRGRRVSPKNAPASSVEWVGGCQGVAGTQGCSSTASAFVGLDPVGGARLLFGHVAMSGWGMRGAMTARPWASASGPAPRRAGRTRGMAGTRRPRRSERGAPFTARAGVAWPTRRHGGAAAAGSDRSHHSQSLRLAMPRCEGGMLFVGSLASFGQHVRALALQVCGFGVGQRRARR